MRITVIGTGYVGLVVGACLAETGNDVTCADVDERKIEHLRRDALPIYEPGLEEIVWRNRAHGRFAFTTELPAAIAGLRRTRRAPLDHGALDTLRGQLAQLPETQHPLGF